MLQTLCLIIVYVVHLFWTWLLDDVIGWRDAKKKKKNAYLHGNFAPIFDELEFELSVTTIPDDFPQGMFVRNGSNPRFPQKHNYHWFEGDGHLHAIEFSSEKKITYRNKFVRTEKFRMEEEFGGPIVHGFLDNANPFVRFTQYYRYFVRGAKSVPDTNSANTGLLYFNDKLYALVEDSYPTEIKLPTLDTVGLSNFNNELQHHMIAHPVLDPKTKELFCMGYKMLGSPGLQYSVFDQHGKRTFHHRFDDSEIPWKSVHHSFALTENYIIFMFYPLIFDITNVGHYYQPFDFVKNKPTKYALVPRYYNPYKDKIRWFEGANGFCFHVANAYEEQDQVILHYCKYEKFSMYFEEPSYEPTLSELRFDLKNNTMKENKLFFKNTSSNESMEIHGEFPMVHESKVASKHQYLYLSGYASSNFIYDSIIKVDVQNMTCTKLELGKSRYAGEWVFVPKIGAKQEDDGYLISFVYDEKLNTSFFEIVDAIKMQTVCSYKLPRRVPYGFHGIFVEAK